MSRYIDADALAEKFHKMGLGENSLIERLFADGVYAVIDTLPTADVEPVLHAYWEKECRSEITFPSGEVAMLIERKCSNCHLWSDKEILKYYPPTPAERCSVCGAKMDGKETEQ